MSELNIAIPVIVETLSQGLVRARTLPPFRLDLIGSSWKEVQRRVVPKFRSALRSMTATKWVTGMVWREVVSTSVRVLIEAPRQSDEWNESIELHLDAFHTVLENDYECLFLPALDLSIVGKQSQLTSELIEQQVRAALDRTIDPKSFREWVLAFHQRRIQLMHVELPWSNKSPEKDQIKQKQERFSRATKNLRSVCLNLSKGSLRQRIYGRDQLGKRLVELLNDESKPSVLLVGPSGAGKTAMVELVARQLSKLGGDYDRVIWSTSGARIVSGMSGFGMWQQRVLQMLRELKETDGVLHLGSLIELLEAGKIQGMPGVASMMRNPISNRRIQAIAEATQEQIASIEREDPILLRSFIRLEVNEPTTDELVTILRSIADDEYRLRNEFVESSPKKGPKTKKQKRRVKKLQRSSEPIELDAVHELIELFRRFATYSALPAPAIRLLRSLIDEHDPKEPIRIADVTRGFAKQSGLPLFLLDDTVPIDLEQIRKDLSAQVMGQLEPIELIVNLLATFKARLSRPDRPLASLLFIGPTGVGKTEMAKALAKIMYNDSSRMIRIDMSEYSKPWSAIRLIGRPGEGDGTLVSPIREQPFSVVLLDEFEKADQAVYDLLLQLLGEGRLTDSLGRIADFRNAIVIMTSNLGVDSFKADGFGFGEGNESSYQQHFDRELRKFVRPELLGRFDRIVPFGPLSQDIVRKIVERDVKTLGLRHGLRNEGISLSVEPTAIDVLVKAGFEPQYGARPIRRAIEEQIVFPISKELERAYPKKVTAIRVDAPQGTIQFHATYTESGQVIENDPVIYCLNEFRELRQKAKLVELSSDMRRLENDLERGRRHRRQIERSMLTTQQPRRIEALRSRLGMLDKQLTAQWTQRDRVMDLIEKISQREHDLALSWYRGLPISADECQSQFADYHGQLRDCLAELQGTFHKPSREGTIIVLGREVYRIANLGKAYQAIAVEQGWTIERWAFFNYDPLRDEKSEAAFKKVQRGNYSPIPLEGLGLPVERLSVPSEIEGVDRKVIDVFAMPNQYEFASLPPSCLGFAIRCVGEGVASMLEEERGVHHLVVDGAVNAVRRWRYYVDFTREKLQHWQLPSQWSENPTIPQRDPRRAYHLAYNTITDLLSSSHHIWDDGDFYDVLLSMIREYAEMNIWRSIGFQRVPIGAKYGNPDWNDPTEIEIPY